MRCQGLVIILQKVDSERQTTILPLKATCQNRAACWCPGSAKLEVHNDLSPGLCNVTAGIKVRVDCHTFSRIGLCSCRCGRHLFPPPPYYYKTTSLLPGDQPLLLIIDQKYNALILYC